NRLGGLGSTLRRKGRSSDSCGAAQALTRRLRPSASGLPPFSGSGLKWALSKARPRRDAAKDKTARAVARRVAGHSCARSRFPTTSIIRRSVGSTRATPPKPDRAGHRSLCERVGAGAPLSGPFEFGREDFARGPGGPPPNSVSRVRPCRPAGWSCSQSAGSGRLASWTTTSSSTSVWHKSPEIIAARSIRVNAALDRHPIELDRDQFLRRTLALELIELDALQQAFRAKALEDRDVGSGLLL